MFKSIIFCLLVSLTFTACQKEVANNTLLSPPIADAGNSQIIQIPPATFTLTGTGTSTNGNIVGYLWSLVSGPNIPAIASPASATTTVSNVVVGTYRFQFMVVDAAGLTGVDTVSVRVNALPTTTITLQPSNNPYDVHVAIVGSSNVTDNNSQEFSGGAWTSGGLPFFTRGFFKFDMSAIPANATIVSAKLSLYSDPTPANGNLVDANFGTNNALYLQRVTSSWNPATIGWANQPAGDAASQISIPSTSLPFLDLVDMDVTSLVAPMVSTNNYGFLVKLQSEVAYNIRIFCSGRHIIAAKHPKLVITYQ